MEQFEHLEETQLSSEAKYDGTLLHIRRDTVRLPDGKTATREYNIHNGAVCIIPLLENGEVLLERQYRGEYRILAVDNRFVEQASTDRALALTGLDAAGIVRTCQTWLGIAAD